MEFFGLFFTLPLVAVATSLYARVAAHIVSLGHGTATAFLVVTAIPLALLGTEASWIWRAGIEAAHDRDPSTFDALHAANTLFAPGAVLNVFLFALKRRGHDILVDPWLPRAKIAAFFLMTGGLLASLVVGEEAHFRTDSEGTYRIRE